jgi:hypothetical protein
VAGFLDSKERVVDLVLTEVGKSHLLRGDLTFVFWIPFDDEVGYGPLAGDLQRDQSVFDRAQQLVESPLVVEARSGYTGPNFMGEDLMNVNRPMFTAPPGVGQTFPVPQMRVSRPATYQVGGQDVDTFVPLDAPLDMLFSDAIVPVPKKIIVDVSQQVVSTVSGSSAVERFGSTEAVLTADYLPGSYSVEHSLEGFLLSVYASSTLHVDDQGNETGGLSEVLHNRDSSGSICYRNDLKVHNYST